MGVKKKYLVLALVVLATSSSAKQKESQSLNEFSQNTYSQLGGSPQEAVTEVGFSPDGSAEELVLKIINVSRKSIRLAAYSFTSPSVVRGLIGAHKRGVDVQVVVDAKGNRSQKNTSAMNLLANAGIPLRTNGRYVIHHDKFIISDERHVQTGSFNYSQAAAKSNSENVVVIWNNAAVASAYLRHWQIRFNDGVEVKPGY